VATKKTITLDEANRDPLWQYSPYEVVTMPPAKLKKLLHGPNGDSQFLPGMLEAYARKVREWRAQKKQ
jgi:hypothetical protein